MLSDEQLREMARQASHASDPTWLRTWWSIQYGRDVSALIAEVQRLRGVIAQHDLCHDLHGKVDARAFADGCAAEQRRIYGCAPDADEVCRLRAALVEAEGTHVRPHP